MLLLLKDIIFSGGDFTSYVVQGTGQVSTIGSLVLQERAWFQQVGSESWRHSLIIVC